MKFRKNAAVIATAMTAAASFHPTLPAFADQVRDAQWHTRYLNLAGVHPITKGAGVKVAVVDSGIFPHADLVRNLKAGHDTVPGGDKFGRTDGDGHGTQMAGLIAGHGRNPKDGVLGIAPSAQLIPIKSTGVNDNGKFLADGIKWAASSGADVINISVGAVRSRPLQDAVAAAVQADAVVVAASGNRSETLRFAYPAAIREVLAVGAVDKNGKLAQFSVTGSKIGICAPGVDLVTTDRDDKYYKGSGTSEATAIVSGAAALVRAKFPELSAQEVIHRLTATATDNGPPGRDDQCGFGVLNIVKALTADVPPLTPAASAGAASPGAGGNSSAEPTDTAGPPSSAEAAPPPEPSGANLPVIVGVGTVVAGIGALLAYLWVRRRRSTPPTTE